MIVRLTSLFALLGLAVFLGFYLYRLQFVPVWIIILGTLLLFVIDVIQAWRNPDDVT